MASIIQIILSVSKKIGLKKSQSTRPLRETPIRMTIQPVEKLKGLWNWERSFVARNDTLIETFKEILVRFLLEELFKHFMCNKDK